MSGAAEVIASPLTVISFSSASAEPGEITRASQTKIAAAIFLMIFLT
jgi:hypothetical protein